MSSGAYYFLVCLCAVGVAVFGYLGKRAENAEKAASTVKANESIAAQLADLKKSLPPQKAEGLTEQKLKERFPDGWIIFDIEGKKVRTYAQSEVSKTWDVDWNQARLQREPDGLWLYYPPIKNKQGRKVVAGALKLTDGVSLAIIDSGTGLAVTGEALKETETGAICVVGFNTFSREELAAKLAGSVKDSSPQIYALLESFYEAFNKEQFDFIRGLIDDSTGPLKERAEQLISDLRKKRAELGRCSSHGPKHHELNFVPEYKYVGFVTLAAQYEKGGGQADTFHISNVGGKYFIEDFSEPNHMADVRAAVKVFHDLYNAGNIPALVAMFPPSLSQGEHGKALTRALERIRADTGRVVKSSEIFAVGIEKEDHHTGRNQKVFNTTFEKGEGAEIFIFEKAAGVSRLVDHRLVIQE